MNYKNQQLWIWQCRDLAVRMLHAFGGKHPSQTIAFLLDWERHHG